MRFTSKFYKRLFITTCIITVGSFLLATYVLPYALLKPKKRFVHVDPATITKKYEAVSIPIAAGDSIRGFMFYPAVEKPKAVLILVHGIGGSKSHFFPLAAKLAKDGYSSIALDNRAHGNSDGEFVTYGYKEKDDISLQVDFIKEKFPDTKVGIWGSSMGGAIAIQAMEQDKRIEFGIIESTFINLEQIVYDYQKRYAGGIGLRFLTDYVLERAGVIADFDPEKVSPENSVKNIEQPLIIAHGDVDKRITYQYGEQLYKNLSSKEKTFELVKGAGHLNVGAIGGETYYNNIKTFIERQLVE